MAAHKVDDRNDLIQWYQKLAELSAERINQRRLEYFEGSSRYCRRCESMMSEYGMEKLKSRFGYQHFSLKEMSLRSEEGCRLCHTVLKASGEYTAAVATEALTFFAMHGNQPVWTSNGHLIDSLGLYGSDGQIRTSVLVYTPADDPAARFISRRPIASDVASIAVSQQLKAWINECQTQHHTCPSIENPPLPTRLIYVGREVDGSWDDLKLYVSKPAEKGHYGALSYCWGQDENVVTTWDNIDTHKHKLEFTNLPKTIQDAITVTRSLGLLYLWVDALCILKHDKDDTAREIQKMGHIYMNATVTIAASTAVSASEGFLQPRKPPESCLFAVRTPDGQDGNINISAVVRHYLPHHPLDSRGWTLQEHQLSPRLILYSEKEVIWRCRKDKSKTIVPGQIIYQQPVQLLPSGIFETCTSRAGRTVMQQTQLWTRIVREYSHRKLTVAADKVNALAGIAKILATFWDDVYIAGHWGKCLIQHLAWWAVFPSSNSLPKNYAPSWSWLSGGSSILFDLVDIPTAKIVEMPLRDGVDWQCGQRLALVLSGPFIDKGSPLWSRLLMKKKYTGRQTYALILGYTFCGKGKKKRVGVGLVLEKADKNHYRRLDRLIVKGMGANWDPKIQTVRLI